MSTSPLSNVEREYLLALLPTASEMDLVAIEELLGIEPPEGTGASAPPAAGDAWTVKTLGDVARFFGLQLQTVKEWRTGSAPDPMPGSEGSWPLPEITRWRLRKAMQVVREPGVISVLEKENFEIRNGRQRLKYQQELGELVSREAAKSACEQMFARISNRLDDLPDELGASIAPEQRGEIIDDVRQKLFLMKKEMAHWSFEEEVA